MIACKEFKIHTQRFTANCIRFGKGSKTLVMISGLNIKDARGKAAALGLAYNYRCFAKDFTVYIFDRREELPAVFGTEEIARDIADCMAELKLSHAYVLGVSQGGMIAQYLALNYPQLVDKLVLGVSASRPNDTVKTVIDRWCGMAGEGNLQGVMKDYFYSTYSESYLKKYALFIPLLIKTVKPMPAERFITLAQSCLSCNTYERLREIKCPVLLIGGEQDKVVSVTATLEMAEKLGCEPVIYSEYGHSAYEEAADFNRRVLKFFTEASENK